MHLYEYGKNNLFAHSRPPQADSEAFVPLFPYKLYSTIDKKSAQRPFPPADLVNEILKF